MKEFLFDANRASFAPRYLLFEMLVKGQPKFGQFSVTHMADPYYKITHLTLENFGSIARFKSGTISETIERIPTEQIQILNIVDGISTKDPSPLSSVISIADKIYTIDTSFPRYKVKEEAIELLNEL